jgi:hypothetical protein
MLVLQSYPPREWVRSGKTVRAMKPAFDGPTKLGSFWQKVKSNSILSRSLPILLR